MGEESREIIPQHSSYYNTRLPTTQTTTIFIQVGNHNDREVDLLAYNFEDSSICWFIIFFYMSLIFEFKNGCFTIHYMCNGSMTELLSTVNITLPDSISLLIQCISDTLFGTNVFFGFYDKSAIVLFGLF